MSTRSRRQHLPSLPQSSLVRRVQRFRSLSRSTLRCLVLFGAVAMAWPAPHAPAASIAGDGPSYSGHRVVRARLGTARELRAALALTDDVWSHSIVGGVIEFRLSPSAYEAFRSLGIPHEVMIADVQAAIEGERRRLAAEQGGLAGDGLPPDWFDDFRDNAAIASYMDALAASRPDLCTVELLGTSLEGRPIRVLRIAAGPGKPAILFNSCQHAREWISPMVTMWIADRLVQQADSDPDIADLLERVEFMIVPVVNPDGYQFSWDVDRLWRKNRRSNGDGSIGVDLNRNWGWEWGGEGASGNPSDATYRGPFAFSEPETQAMRDWFEAHPQIAATIDFHSFSQLVLWPWAWTGEATPDAPLYDLVGGSMIDTITGVNGEPYGGGPVYTTLYPASGGSIDWTYGARGALSFTVELRDTGEFGFILPPDQIGPTCAENLPAALQLADLASRPALLSLDAAPPATIEWGVGTPIAGRTFDVLDEVASVTLWARVGTAASFQPTQVAAGDGPFAAALPAAPCGALVQWYLEADTVGGDTVRLPDAGPAGPFESVAVAPSTILDERFENGPAGWSVGAPGDNASAGVWVQVDPNGTIAQPENDHSVPGTVCFVTGQGAPGAAAGTADVDNGVTTLVSPILDASAPGTTLSFWLWYSNDLGASPGTDSMLVEISGDGGASWSLLEEIDESATAWVERSYLLEQHLPPTGTLRVRFVARDLGQGSLVEAALDDLRLTIADCLTGIPGDFDRDGDVDGADLGVLLAAWDPDGGAASDPADLDGDGDVDGGDLGILLANWN